MGETHLNSRLNRGKHRLNKDIQRVLLYWAELQLTTLDHTLRLNSRVLPLPAPPPHSEKKGIKTKAYISPNIKSSHSQPSQ